MSPLSFCLLAEQRSQPGREPAHGARYGRVGDQDEDAGLVHVLDVFDNLGQLAMEQSEVVGGMQAGRVWGARGRGVIFHFVPPLWAARFDFPRSGRPYPGRGAGGATIPGPR